MTAIATPHHRVSVAVARVHDELDVVADSSVWSMDESETAATLVSLSRAMAKMTELQARVAAHADDLHLGQHVAATSAANWLAHETKQTRAETNRTVKLGHDLEAHPRTREALATGTVCEEQARVIIQAVDRLPAEAHAKAEQNLLAEAAHHDAKTLRMLGKRLYEVIDPDAADAHEAALLAREEAAAAKSTVLRIWYDGHGVTHLRGQIPTFHGAALKKMLQSIAAPKHQRAVNGAGVERLPGPEAMGQALCELITRYPVKKLPKVGGLNATVVVTISEDSLMGRVEQAGILDTGEHLSPGLARKIACEAGIIPAVLDGDSIPLDVGRKKRHHTEYQRVAIILRDKTCRAEGCDRTGSLHVHHRKRWVDGGETTVTEGIALCPWHHSRIHDSTYETQFLPTGRVAFHRRQ